MIIVTGGAGLIGSAVVWKLNQLGRDDIIIVDHLGNSDKWRNLAPLHFRDYLEKDCFLPLLEGSLGSGPVEAIIHLGACSSTTERDASYLYYTCADAAKLHSAGYAGKSTSLEEAIADYVKNYLTTACHLGDRDA